MRKKASDEIGLKSASSEFTKRFRPGILFTRGIVFLATIMTIALLIGMLGYILTKGLGSISWTFLTTAPSALNETYGILPMIINTVYIILLGLLIAIPIGIGGAIYLAEYAKQGRIINLIRSTIEILAGIPSIVYGLFGSVLFVTVFNFGYSILSGALTLSIMVLPTMIRTTEESLMAVDATYREAAVSMGVSKFYTIKTLLVPCAMAGILAATILSIGRMVGETAALLYTSSIADTMPVISSLKDVFLHAMDSGATLTVQMYLYGSEGGVPDGIIYALASVLIIIVFVLNMSVTAFAKRLKKE